MLSVGKGVVDETPDNFYGVHAGEYGRVDNSAYANEADPILLFGPLLSDSNTTSFSTLPNYNSCVTFHKDTINVFNKPREPYQKLRATKE